MTGPIPAVAATRLAVRRCLPDARAVIVAVSGGADSLALLAATAFEAPKQAEHGVRVLAVTVDHGLQAGSAEQAANVAEQAASLGVDAEVVRVVVDGVGGPEAAARDARYAALTAAAQRFGADAILLGHTLDDQAETVLLGLARGSGARSLAGMPAAAGLLRRPFLGLRRTETEQACAAAGLQPWSDPMNDDDAYARVRVRRSALPALEATVGPGVAEALARTAAQLSADADALDGWAVEALRAATDDAGGLDVGMLSALPAAVRTRVLKAAALRGGVPAGSITATHVRELDRLVTDWRGQGPVALPGPYNGSRDCDRLRFGRPL